MEIPEQELEFEFIRSSGPGGQHANVTSSRIEARFDVAASAVLSETQKERVTARCGPVVRACRSSFRRKAWTHHHVLMETQSMAG